MGATTANQNIDLDAGLLGRLRELKIQVIVDLSLVVEATCCAAGSAQAREEDGRSRLNGRDIAGPFSRVLDDSVELGIRSFWRPAGEGVDCADDWKLEERGENVRALEGGSATVMDVGQGRQGWQW